MTQEIVSQLHHEIQNIAIGIFILILATFIYGVVWVLHTLKHRNANEIKVIMDGIEIFVKSTPSKFDDRLFDLIKGFTDKQNAPSISEITETLTNANNNNSEIVG